MGKAVVIATFLSAAFIIFLILTPGTRPDGQTIIPTAPKPKLEAPIIARNVTPEETLPGPSVIGEKLERLPAKEQPPKPKRKPKPIKIKRVDVVEAGILKSGKHKIQLSDITPLGLDETCKSASGKQWPCGRFARTELRQFIRNRPVDCDDALDDTPELNLRCRLDSYDISGWLVLTGWAVPKGDNFKKELTEAKSKKRGQWRKSAP